MALHFATDAIEVEFYKVLIPQTQVVLLDFAMWSRTNKLPEPVVTGLSRSGPAWYRERGLTPPAFSWHYVVEKDGVKRTCAADLRNQHYSQEQLAKVNKWFGLRCLPRAQYELITKLHGTGPHIHVAYRDFALKREWEKQHGAEAGQ